MLGDICVSILLGLFALGGFVMGVSILYQSFYPYFPGDRRNPEIPPKMKAFFVGLLFLALSFGAGVILWFYW